MKTTASSFAAATATLMAAAVSQSPTFRMDPAVMLGLNGATITYDLSANSGTMYSMLASLDGGPIGVLGERFYLGLTPAPITLGVGVMPAAGIAAGSLQVPAFAGFVGLAIYGQGAVIDTAAPNGLFRATNAESSLIYGSPTALVVDFDDPAASGFTGNYSQQIAGHVSGGPVTHRTHRTISPQGVFFPLPLPNPLNPHGCREQMVYRVQDLRATGVPEVVTAIRWFSATPLVIDSFQQFEIAIGHSPVVPDYTVGAWTALPVAPGSGLNPLFHLNHVPSAPPVTVYQGPYVMVPAMQRPDGYVPLPAFTPFAYDGTSSLLIEFKTFADPQATGANGMYGSLMVQSSPLPAARNKKGGTAGALVNPAQVTQGTGDNWMADLQIEFARIETNAQSPWHDSGLPAPDYGAPAIAASLSSGTSVQIEYRGTAALGTTPTAWSSSPNIADGLRYLQFRMTFLANLQSGEVPVVDTLVVPIN